MALAHSTAQQRIAVKKAAADHRMRVGLRNRLRRRGTSFKRVLQHARTDEVLGRVRVFEVLQMMPGIGKLQARTIMTELGLAPTRRLGGLDDRQRQALLARFETS